MRRKFKRFCTLALALLLLGALIPSGRERLSSIAASVSDAFSQSFDADDYREVMSEPDVLTGSGYATLTKNELKSLRLYPGGTPFGVKFMTEGVLVVGFCDVEQRGALGRRPHNLAQRQEDLGIGRALADRREQRGQEHLDRLLPRRQRAHRNTDSCLFGQRGLL